MTGLVGYGSSGEEDFTDEDQPAQLKSRVKTVDPAKSELGQGQRSPLLAREKATVALAEDGPAQPSETHFNFPPQIMISASSALSAPSSPYANQRATIRSLTLPIQPNLDIPQSPLGSPTLGAERFSHFLNLKKQGIHFNIKLASSSALKNPSLLPRLMGFTGVGSELQYTTTLPTELWDPVGLPTWAYKEGLAEAQHRRSKTKEEEKARLQRETIDFVTPDLPRQSSGSIVAKAMKARAAGRVTAGLDKEKQPLPSAITAGDAKRWHNEGGE